MNIKTLVFGFALLAGPGMAQVSDLSERALKGLARTADKIATTETGAVPRMLVLALMAAEQSDHLDRPPPRSSITQQLARMHLGSMQLFERKASEIALTTYLGERLTPWEVAEVYAASIYLGRNCYGYRDAVRGLARQHPEQASDAVWLALAALPRSPALYLGNRAALKDRVARIVDTLRSSGLVDPDEAKRLSTLPLANIDSGKGCSSN